MSPTYDPADRAEDWDLCECGKARHLHDSGAVPHLFDGPAAAFPEPFDGVPPR